MLLDLARRAVVARREGDTWYLSSPDPLVASDARLGDLLRASAAAAPDRDFLVERTEDGALRRTTWSAALRAAEGIAAWLVRDLPPGARVVSLSGNGTEHALLMLGSYLAGAPFVPISQAYSLASHDFVKLRRIFEKVRPAVVFAAQRAPFAKALDAVVSSAMVVVDAAGVIVLGTREKTEEAKAREAEVRSTDVAKILFTSGSTGFPKGVPTTHTMLCANQQMIAQCWPFLEKPDAPAPVVVDWLPWSHTFGGNHNFDLILRNAGTLLIDEGRPTPAGIELSITNLRALPPTLYFNVPAGFAALVPRLEADDELARTFFQRLEVVFYAAAALPADLWTRLRALAARWSANGVFLTTAWGSTETSPLATSMHFESEAAGNIGLPAPGVTLKLAPNGSKLEIRVKGPNVMAGYLDEPELTAEAFDDEGFYRIGDAVRLDDLEHPEEGLIFDGRVAEDFKLTSGTWVSVSHVRLGVIAEAGGVIADCVVCGHDRESIAVLAWPSLGGCAAVAPGASTLRALVTSNAVRQHVLEAIARWNKARPASSTRIARVVLLDEPPDLDAGEITDKGYTNQRIVRERRAPAIAELFAVPAPPHVLVLDDAV